MSNKTSILDLEAEVKNLAEDYVKGMAAKMTVSSSVAGASNISFPEEFYQIATQNLDLMLSHYEQKNLPQELAPPCSKTRELQLFQKYLGFFASTCRKALAGDSLAQKKVHNQAVHLKSLGDTYQQHFENSFQLLREQEGFEDYIVEVKDLDGNIWNFDGDLYFKDRLAS